MLAAERRGELGIARAIGTRRGHLVEMFTFEGAAYDLVAAVVGALLGAVVAFGMVFVMAQRLRRRGRGAASRSSSPFTWQSLLIAFALGVLLTLVVVAVLGLAGQRDDDLAAIRNLPEPPVGAPAPAGRARRARPRARRSLLVVTAGNAATPLMLGVSLVLVGLVPFAAARRRPRPARVHRRGARDRRLWMLPWSVWEAVFGPALDGLLDLDRRRPDDRRRRGLGDRLQRRPAARRGDGVLGRIEGARAACCGCRWRTRSGAASAPARRSRCSRSSSSRSSPGRRRPARSRPRSTTSTTFGGGFQVRAGTGGARADRRHARGARPRARAPRRPTIRSSGASPCSRSTRGSRTGRPLESYPVRGLDSSFLEHTTFGLGAIATRLLDSARGLDGARRSTRPRGRRQPRRPAPRQLRLRRAAARLQAHRASTRTTAKPSTRSRSRSRDTQTGSDDA